MLWRGRKFHFRAYALLRADMSAWLYRTAYILSASRPYSLKGVGASGGDGRGAGFADELVHISNLAVNKHTDSHPGQVRSKLDHRAGGSIGEGAITLLLASVYDELAEFKPGSQHGSDVTACVPEFTSSRTKRMPCVAGIRV